MAGQPTSNQPPGHPIVVKIGGSTLGSHDTSLKDLARLQQEGREVVVVHGGGNVISQWMQRQGLAPRFVGGLRVTDAPSLEIVVAVLTGLINKELVSSMHEFGGRSVGLSGIDGSMVEAKIGNPELGFVGEVTTVNVDLIRSVLDSGYIPMIAPLGFHVRDGSEHAGSPLNINGDTVAGELAYALEAEQLVFLTDVAGVMDGGGRVIRRLDRRRAGILSNSGVIQGGMIPKLSACLRALERSPVANIIDGRQPDALLECLRGNSTGTTIVEDFRAARRRENAGEA
ncbi:MAG: acetylglutamate kinase [SAR202 cluster bacterium MP-NPac-SRR3961935-G1]|nr:MAG: acetylglutamate kinase [SAR202 cluster bacterium MP-SInd-SRR3963457-G1]PKB85078.1 MAG: acetylglutamate kinase [SAR202 cluster bacterium MP-NPac-SRR3961935-G1]